MNGGLLIFCQFLASLSAKPRLLHMGFEMEQPDQAGAGGAIGGNRDCDIRSPRILILIKFMPSSTPTRLYTLP